MTNAVAVAQSPRDVALLKAIGFDRLSVEQRELALNIADRYELDPLLKHLVMIEGRAYITRDGLLHIAHRSGKLDGIETSEPSVVDGFWRSTCSVYRKDMTRPFTYTGRYPTTGGNAKFAPEMAVKVGEVMALRRAFDVAAPTAEERWDVPEAVEPSQSAATPTLAERAAAKAETARNADAARAESSQEPAAEPQAPRQPAAVQEAPAEPVAEREAAEAAPGEVVASAPIGRLAFMARIKEAGVTQDGAIGRASVLFPGIPPKDLSDEQRGLLLDDLMEGLTPTGLAAL